MKQNEFKMMNNFNSVCWDWKQVKSDVVPRVFIHVVEREQLFLNLENLGLNSNQNNIWELINISEL